MKLMSSVPSMQSHEAQENKRVDETDVKCIASVIARALESGGFPTRREHIGQFQHDHGQDRKLLKSR